MIESAQDSEGQRATWWTRRALAGLMAGAGIGAVLGPDMVAKKKKKRKNGKNKSDPAPRCQRNCGGRTCGDDGCGGSCGSCGAGASCEAGQCLTRDLYEFEREWGSFGTSGGSKFNHPWGIAVDENGDVFVADSGNDRIQKFSSTGQFLAEWGTTGTDDGQFSEPAGIAAAAGNVIYIADSSNHRIQKFTNVGGHLLTWGTLGTNDGEFQRPQGLAVNRSDGRLYVSENLNPRMQKFLDSTHLATLQLDAGGPYYGRGLATDDQDLVYVSAYGKDQIIRLASPSIEGRAYGTSGSENGQLKSPNDVAVDADGNVFVADRGNNRIQVFDEHGSFLTGWGTVGSAPGQFRDPIGIDVDVDGNVYVTDLSNHRVQKFRPVSSRQRRE